jgi:hypothetical protein
MIEVIASVLLVTVVLVVAIAFWAITNTVTQHQRYLADQARRHHAERMALIDERDALLERIQRPEFRPTTRRDEAETAPVMELPEMDLAMVGQVVTEASDEE